MRMSFLHWQEVGYNHLLKWATNRKLTDWDDDDPQTMPDQSSKWDKVVILKHMFSLQELEVSKPSSSLMSQV